MLMQEHSPIAPIIAQELLCNMSYYKFFATHDGLLSYTSAPVSLLLNTAGWCFFNLQHPITRVKLRVAWNPQATLPNTWWNNLHHFALKGDLVIFDWSCSVSLAFDNAREVCGKMKYSR